MIKIQSPTRFDLAGGTLDMWPIWALLGKASTINVSISIFTHCHLEPQAGKKIVIESEDLNKTWTFQSYSDLMKTQDPQLAFFQTHLSFWKPSEGFRMMTRSDSPVGGGLGGSSSLSVSIYKAFAKWLRNEEPEIHSMVRDCSNIEAYILKKPTGTQDYYGAAAQGLNIINYEFSGPELTTLHTHKEEFNKRFLIVYTGKSHHSGINNWQVLKNYIDEDADTIQALKRIQGASNQMRELCLQQKWKDVPAVFDEEFAARDMLAEAFMSKEIRELKALSEAAGAEALKICGAGGGGCVVVWTDPDKRDGIRKKIAAGGFQVLDAGAI